jgi:hypothetical protein
MGGDGIETADLYRPLNVFVNTAMWPGSPK